MAGPGVWGSRGASVSVAPSGGADSGGESCSKAVRHVTCSLTAAARSAHRVPPSPRPPPHAAPRPGTAPCIA
eukprot:3166779-Prymnesium_polylepis.1